MHKFLLGWNDYTKQSTEVLLQRKRLHRWTRFDKRGKEAAWTRKYLNFWLKTLGEIVDAILDTLASFLSVYETQFYD